MKHSLVIFLLGLGLLGAYFGVRGQDSRSPWPPRPIVPPEPEGSEPVPKSVRGSNPGTPPVFPTGAKSQEPPPPLPPPSPSEKPKPTPPEAMPDPVFPDIP